MSMNLHSGAGDGLFDIQGKAMHAIDVLNRATGTTVAGVVQDTVDQLNLITPIPLTYEQAGSSLPSALSGWQSSGGGLAQTLSTFCQSLLVAFVQDDSGQQNTTLTAALGYLIAQMTTAGDYVTPNVVAGVLTIGGANVGDAVLCWTLLDGTGHALQNAYAETITMTVGSNPSANRPQISCVGEPAVSLLNFGWPGGSGLSLNVAATDPNSSLLTNGTFETSTYANIPDGWIVAVGVPGTTVKLTAPEQETIAITGTPTGGSYIVKYTDRNSRVWATPAIAWNATASGLQTALRTIPDLSQASVTATGTTPNWTHTVVFTGLGGDVTQLTSISLLTGGSPSITHATTVAGNANDYRGISLELVGDSTTLPALYCPLTGLKSETVYFVHARLRRSGAATGAVIKLAIVQQIGGSPLADDASNSNELIISVPDVSATGYTSEWFAVRLAANTVSPVYLRIAVTTAIPTSSYVYIDEVAVAAGTQLYSGGPFVAAFSGRTTAQSGDTYSLAVTNTHAGLWVDWYQRCFDLATKGLLLPTTGSTLIDQTELYPA